MSAIADVQFSLNLMRQEYYYSYFLQGMIKYYQ